MSAAKAQPSKRAPNPTPAASAGAWPPGSPSLLLEAAHRLSQLAVTVVGAVVCLLSALAGASPLVIVARAGGAVLALGLVLWLINSLLNRSALGAMRRLLEERASEARNTREWEA
jgi:hypothetical protein